MKADPPIEAAVSRKAPESGNVDSMPTHVEPRGHKESGLSYIPANATALVSGHEPGSGTLASHLDSIVGRDIMFRRDANDGSFSWCKGLVLTSAARRNFEMQFNYFWRCHRLGGGESSAPLPKNCVFELFW